MTLDFPDSTTLPFDNWSFCLCLKTAKRSCHKAITFLRACCVTIIFIHNLSSICHRAYLWHCFPSYTFYGIKLHGLFNKIGYQCFSAILSFHIEICCGSLHRVFISIDRRTFSIFSILSTVLLI